MRRRLVRAAGLLAVCLAALVWAGNASAGVVDPILLADAKSSPARSERVIILSSKAVAGATDAFKKASAVKDGYGTGTLLRQLPLVGGVVADLPAARMATLAKLPGVTVSPDATLRQTAFDGYSNIKGTLNRADDTAAPWSTWGYTLDGFAKPDIGASGRYMVGAVPAGSTLLEEFPNNVSSPGYLQLSGTSFAAPVVAGAAAQLLALRSELTPDQVKGALMLGSE